VLFSNAQYNHIAQQIAVQAQNTVLKRRFYTNMKVFNRFINGIGMVQKARFRNQIENYPVNF
jgi:hypothetical protein